MMSSVGYTDELQRRATAIISAADANDPVAVTTAELSAHDVLLHQHRVLFLKDAFGVDSTGALLPGDDGTRLSRHKKVKSVKIYNDIVRCVSNWGDSKVPAALPPTDLEASATYRF